MLDGRFDPEFTLSLAGFSDVSRTENPTAEDPTADAPTSDAQAAEAPARGWSLVAGVLPALIATGFAWLGWRA